MRYIIYPYKMGSETARQLATALDAKRVYPDRNYRPRPDDVIINMGNSRYPDWLAPMLNDPGHVALAANKLDTFRTLTEAGIPTVPWTNDRNEALEWDVVYCRSVLNGHSGAGITVHRRETNPELLSIADRVEALGLHSVSNTIRDYVSEGADFDLPEVPLYTMGVQNHGEYRVHVFRGEIIDYRKKSRRVNDDGSVDTPTAEQSDVRTLDNGWVFRQSDLNRVERIENLAREAIDALGLDFGAVDIIKDDEGNIMVVEVNSAVAMDNTTLANYVTAIRNYAATRNSRG